MEEKTLRLAADDGASLFARSWGAGSGSPRGLVLVSHGMMEHSGRYAYLASRLSRAGFETWAPDHRGHGLTAVPGRLGCSDGFFRVVRDLELWRRRALAGRDRLPVFLLGQSWGSFLAQAYMEEHGAELAGCALSGTRGPGGPVVALGAAVASAFVALGGADRPSPLLRLLAEGRANKAFAPNRTAFDWLTRDEASVDAFVADPLCGFLCSAAFYRDLARGLLSIHAGKNIAKIPKDLPVFIFSGEADEVGRRGKSPAALAEAYRRAGLGRLEFSLYPRCRHEPLNETNRDEVIGALLSWMDLALAGRGAASSPGP